MRKVAFLILIALGLAVYGCGNNNPPNAVTTSTNGNWEAHLANGTGQESELTFVIDFSVSVTTGETPQGLTVTGFSFINAGPCFLTGITATNQGGSATLTTMSTGQVSGNMSLTITSRAGSGTTQAGNVLTLTSIGGVYGTSNGTTATAGTLSNGVVVGTWSLTGPCTNGVTTPSNPTFIMCQNTATCTAPGT